MSAQLTTPEYWGAVQHRKTIPEPDPSSRELLAALRPFLEERKGESFLELGCSPGFVSGWICREHNLLPSGVDNAPTAELYIENVRACSGKEAKLYHSDLREFHPEQQFDIVASFGLIEHFAEPESVLLHHDRLCKPGGLVIVSVPNFTKVQWLYHYVFDRPDLQRHNLNAMVPDLYRSFAEQAHHEVLLLGHRGSLNFWNYDLTGPKAFVAMRKVATGVVRLAAKHAVRYVLPKNNKWYAPWLVYVGRKATA